MSNKSVGGGIAALGVVLAVVGVFLYVYEETESTWWGLSSETTNPYQDMGMVLLVLGIIIVVVGLIVLALPGKSSTPPP